MASALAPESRRLSTENQSRRVSTENGSRRVSDQKVLAYRKQSFQRPSHFTEYGAEIDPASILHNPHFNKGTAFAHGERAKLGLRGLLPYRVETIETQVKRVYEQLQRFQLPMSKHIFLSSLRERNETVFYHLVIENMEELMPFIYTPTVGQACLEFGLQFRQAEGMYFCREDRGQMREMLDNWRPNTKAEVAIVVVTDGSRILGLGDLGACGMGIPIGKLSLYVAAGGFHPATTLPVILDTGTNNEKLLEDEFYLGQRHKRLGDKEYFPLVEEFLLAVRDKWPRALLQFEDFSNNHCFQLLSEYREKLLCFNDDIQGTGVTIGAGVLNALKIAGLNSKQCVSNLRFVFAGAGAAGTGVADQIRRALMKRFDIEVKTTYKMFYMIDSKGLVTTTRADANDIPAFKKPYARDDMNGKEFATILEMIDTVKPHALIGLSGKPGQFGEAELRRMAELNDRPIVFPLSNPTSNSECTFEQAVNFTDGRVVFASGSPFPNIDKDGKTLYASQGNNLYAFPGIGFGAWLGKSTTVTDSMMDAATVALADSTSQHMLDEGRLYPPLRDAREVAAVIATAVIMRAKEEGNMNATELPLYDREALLNFVKRSMYTPSYLEWTTTAAGGGA